MGDPFWADQKHSGKTDVMNFIVGNVSHPVPAACSRSKLLRSAEMELPHSDIGACSIRIVAASSNIMSAI